MISRLEEELEYAPLSEEALEADLEWDQIVRFARNASQKAKKVARDVMVAGGLIASSLAGHDQPHVPEEPLPIERKERKPPAGQGEFAASNGSRHPALMMEHFARSVAEAESEAEAQAFVSALVPAAARLIPRAANDIMAAAPQLILGLSNAARLLRKRPETRPLVRVLPTALRSTLAAVARRSSAGRPVTPAAISTDLGRRMARVLRDPRLTALALRRSQLLDRKYRGQRS